MQKKYWLCKRSHPGLYTIGLADMKCFFLKIKFKAFANVELYFSTKYFHKCVSRKMNQWIKCINLQILMYKSRLHYFYGRHDVSMPS